MDDRYSRFIAGTLLAGSFSLPIAQGIICNEEPIEFSHLRPFVIEPYEKECHVPHAPHDHREISVYDSTGSTYARLSASATGPTSIIGANGSVRI